MCGIFAYAGQSAAAEVVLAGLRRLEYRGYDSWGIAVSCAGRMETYKETGAISEIDTRHVLPDSRIALGHTRWATHGEVNISNCHPHVGIKNDFSIVHNGIVENYQHLKAQLQEQGAEFTSDTDTEVILRLIECYVTDGDDLRQALKKSFQRLEGRNTIVLLGNEGQRIVAVKNGSPLVIGKKSRDQETDDYFFASDSLSFADHTDQCLNMADGNLLDFADGEISLFEVKGMKRVDPEWITLPNEYAAVDKGDYPHFMLKEIMEQWQTIPRAAAIDVGQLERAADLIQRASSIVVTGAGGASCVAEQIAWQFRQVTTQACVAVKAYELESWRAMLQPGDVLIAISQSGETADTLAAIAIAREQKMRVISVVNMPGSTIADQSDICFSSRCGPEICVLSTKSATAQLSWGQAMARHMSGRPMLANDIDSVAHQLSQVLDRTLLNRARKIAEVLREVEHMFVLGRNKYFAAAKIGALNIKEASYIHAEAFAAGELKHGVIALIEEGIPVIVFADAEDGYMINVASEVKARGATVIGIAEEDNELFDYHIPPVLPGTDFSAVASIIPCQLLAYYLAVLRGNNPDRPRNLAKSVTVL